MEKKDSDEIRRELIDKCCPEDFYGHTNFEKLTPLEKLRWLSNTAYLVYTVAKKQS